jgi:hypothetical protein
MCRSRSFAKINTGKVAYQIKKHFLFPSACLLLLLAGCGRQVYQFKPGDLVYNYKTGYTYRITGIEPRKRGFLGDRNDCFYQAVNAADSSYRVRWLPQHSLRALK